MAISTVNVDFSATLQNAAQATGLLRVRLSQVGTVEDSETGDTVILPIAWQETTLTDGAATLALVPNKIIEPSCTYYEIQLKSVPDCPKACAKLLLSGIMYVPDEDCNVLDLLISPPSPETANTASGYASQAKQAAQVAENFAIQAGDRYDDVAEAAATALTDIGTAKQDALDAIGTAQSGATEAISTAEDAALQAIGQARGAAIDDIGTAQGTAIGAVQAEGNTQVGRVYDAGEDAVADVTAAQATAVSAVQAQQATSVEAVSAEGTAQVNAVTQAGNGYVATMQGLVSDAQAARDAAQTAQGLAEDAQAAAESASTDAQGYAGDASTSAGQAAQSASDAATSVTAAQASADSIAASAEQIQTNERNISNIQALLNGTLYREDADSTAAYSKAVPAGALPYASVDMIGGKTVVWNQLMTPTIGTVAGITTTQSEDGTVTCVGTNTASGWNGSINCSVAAHKYIFLCEDHQKLDENSTVPNLLRNFSDAGTVIAREKYYFDNTGGSYGTLRVAVRGGKYINFSAKYSLIDLTLMFGSGNEPATVAEFEAMFPSIAPAYNAGELMSAGVTEAVSYPKNQLPLVTDMTAYSANGITVTFNADGSYNINGTYTADSNLTIIRNLVTPYVCQGGYFHMRNNKANGSLPFTLYTEGRTEGLVFYGNSVNKITAIASENIGKTYPQMSIYIVRNVQYDNITIHPSIEVSDSVTAYTPYRSPVFYPIPAAIQALPGYGWSAGTHDNSPDVYNGFSFVTKMYAQRIAKYEFTGAETITLVTTGDNYNLFTFAALNLGRKGGWTCPYRSSHFQIFKTGVWGSGWQSANGYAWGVYMPTTYTSADVVKTWLAQQYAAGTPVTFYYELATPIETDISSLLTDSTIEVEPGGTLTFKNQHGDNFRLPVPNSETFLVQATPELPSADGTYTLQCTVTDGTPSVTWVTA